MLQVMNGINKITHKMIKMQKRGNYGNRSKGKITFDGH